MMRVWHARTAREARDVWRTRKLLWKPGTLEGPVVVRA
jgi:hypothetical protein